MLFKTLALGLLGAASVAHAAQIPFTKNSRLECVLKQESAIDPGVYKIINAASHTSLRSYRKGNPIYVASTLEYPGPFELWELTPSDDEGAYNVKNVGLDEFTYAEQGRGKEVTVDQGHSTFAIKSAGDNTYTIKVPDADLVWTAKEPVIPMANVMLDAAIGTDNQRWTLVRSDDYNRV